MSTQNPQYMVKRLVPKWRLLKMTSPEKYGTGPVGLLKNYIGECSEVALASVIFVGSFVSIYLTYLGDKKTNIINNKPYKNFYTVYRPDDPRIEKLRKEWFANGAPAMTSTKI
eukprot:GFUD01002080.1.p1 GENE.GFUD01002080.1~~GFUD01002080.1.p1  ORF type:complete len:113 (-),score=32.38 GFUD01002080.1:102-440(-)